jgi:hypothetical protein
MFNDVFAELSGVDADTEKLGGVVLRWDRYRNFGRLTVGPFAQKAVVRLVP